jgi:hypothetical protein
MKSAYNMISEARVAFEKACTDLGKAVHLHKGNISKKTYESMAVVHLAIINDVLRNSEENARALDKALEPEPGTGEPPDPASVTPTWKNLPTKPAKDGTTMAMEDEAKKAGYLPKGKRTECPNHHKPDSACHGPVQNTLVTLVKGNSSIKACKCGYRKTLDFRPIK